MLPAFFKHLLQRVFLQAVALAAKAFDKVSVGCAWKIPGAYGKPGLQSGFSLAYLIHDPERENRHLTAMIK